MGLSKASCSSYLRCGRVTRTEFMALGPWRELGCPPVSPPLGEIPSAPKRAPEVWWERDRYDSRVIPGKESNPESKLRIRSMPCFSMIERCTASRAERRLYSRTMCFARSTACHLLVEPHPRCPAAHRRLVGLHPGDRSRHSDEVSPATLPRLLSISGDL